MVKNKMQFATILAIVMAIALLSFVGGFVIFNVIVMHSIVAKGNEIMVPDLRGKFPARAEEEIREIGLKIEVVGYQADTSVEKGFILNQKPQAGEVIKPGRKILVYLSSGREVVNDLKLVNRSIREAELKFEENGITIDQIFRTYSNTGVDLVIDTYPPPTIKLFSGQSADLLVSLGKHPKVYIMPNLVGKQYVYMKQKLEQFGSIVPEPVYRRDSRAIVGQILSQKPLAGSQIQRGEIVYLNVND
ncbi:MAG: hypothetical protein B6244_07330 [Candidatus Cloacimonetes bacterium 4572_55]|nr:MAG: hypothetical protein B6244_07330 [Candidatus Cloacimonetes bacterium 4572_55]